MITMSKIISTAKLQIAGLIITNEEYEFDWRYQDKNDNNPSFLEISLPNLTKKFQNKILKGTQAIFDFGFDKIGGTLVNGTVDTKTVSFPDDVTEITKLKIIEIDVNGFSEISKSYKNKKTSFIIQDIANELGYIIKTLELKSDILQQNGYVAYGKGINIMKKLVQQANINIRIEGNFIYIYDTDIEVKETSYIIKFGAGLLKAPLQIEETGKDYDYVIEALANPEIRKNSVIKVETENLNSFCKVIELDLDNWVGQYFVKVMEV